ncbi:MAG: SMI1/KNR4 family protein [Sphingomonas sp.]
MFGWLRRIVGRHRVPPAPPVLRSEKRGRAFYQELADHWGAQAGQRPAREIVAREVAGLERRCRVKLPPDFRAYLFHAAPVEMLYDEHLTGWWPIGRIRTVAQECEGWTEGEVGVPPAREADAWLVFADGMIWSWAWAICCSDGPDRGRVAVIGGSDEPVVADSFREFVLLALEDSHRILPV